MAMVGASSVAVAQGGLGGALPGREREQLLDRQTAPRAQPGGPAVSLPSTVAPEGAAKINLTVRQIRIVGSTVYSAEQLAPLYQPLIGRRVPLQAIYDLAQAITAKYGADGYVLSRAIVPPQELAPGGAVVRIEVVEGYVDKVEWPAKLARYRDFFSYYASKITSERPANVRTMERYLLLANDLPGLKFTSSLRASKTNRNASTMVVEVAEKPVDLFARVDNRGTQSRGPWQYYLSPTFQNLAGAHEALTLAYAGVSPPKELQFVAPSYRQVLTPEGLTVFVNASYGWGYPGGQILEALNFKTRSTYVEGGAYSPIVRTRERNLTATALMFMSESYSFINADQNNPFNVDRLRGVRLRLEGDMADRLNGINQFSTTLSQGIEGLGSTENGQPFASRPAGRVDFTKLEVFVSRIQPLPARFSAQIAGYGQYGFTPLLSPEQCSYGGRVFGRAYDPSDLLGDSCLMGFVELRYDLPTGAALAPSTQLYTYVDKGYRYIKSAPVGLDATATAASAGAGVRLNWQNHVNVDLSAAKAIEGFRNDWRFFLIASARN
jgi:hemolysin activation/secretion protein